MNGGDPTLKGGHGRVILDRYHEDHLTPAERMAQHQASKAHRGDDPHTTRLQIRAKLGDESKLVRGMYDRTVKPKRKGRASQEKQERRLGRRPRA